MIIFRWCWWWWFGCPEKHLNGTAEVDYNVVVCKVVVDGPLIGQRKSTGGAGGLAYQGNVKFTIKEVIKTSSP